jgi:hypothetical protein
MLKQPGHNQIIPSFPIQREGARIEAEIHRLEGFRVIFLDDE